jgi:hypothetical protein
MSKASRKNALVAEVVSLSMRIARKYVAPYSHRNSPKKFTQEQLITCLILKAYLNKTYRDIVDLLEVTDELRKRMGLTQVPHYSTLKKFADRSDTLHIVDCMLLEIVREFDMESEEAAIDSTGLETTSASAHYKTRSGMQRKKYIKVSVCVMTATLLPSSLHLSWGPGNDKSEAGSVLAKASNVNRPQRLLADAGYDAEWVHEFCREQWQTESIIKPAVHRADGKMNGKYRSQMTEETLQEKNYGRRWLVESFMSGLKRTTNSALRSRTEHGLFIEAAMNVLAYALRR